MTYTMHRKIKNNLLSILRMHRTQGDTHFLSIFKTLKNTANALDIKIKIPRTIEPSNKSVNPNVKTLETPKETIIEFQFLFVT